MQPGVHDSIHKNLLYGTIRARLAHIVTAYFSILHISL